MNGYLVIYKRTGTKSCVHYGYIADLMYYPRKFHRRRKVILINI